MSPSSQDYWRQRAVDFERDWNKRSKETMQKQLARYYEQALREIKRDIRQLYSTFAKDNGISFKEAQRVLRNHEYKETRSSAHEYISNYNAGLTRELNILMTRERLTRLDKLYIEAIQELDRLGRKVSDSMRSFLGDAYKDSYRRDIFDVTKKGKAQVPVAKADATDVDKVLATRWSGKNYNTRIWGNTRKLCNIIRKTVNAGIRRETPVEQLAKQIDDKMHSGYQNALRLVQTEMNFAINQAHAAAMEAAGIMWYEFIAVLDNRTSAMCRARNGETYPLEEKSVGFNFPPLHPRCRSTVAPYIEELGKRGKRRVKVKGEMVRIPASMTYKDYKAVYIDKKTTLEQWLNKKGVSKAQSTPTAVQNMPVVLQSAPKNSTITPTKNAKATKNDTQKLPLKDQIEPLRQKLLQQKASGASPMEMEVTVKEAGKAIVEEIKDRCS